MVVLAAGYIKSSIVKDITISLKDQGMYYNGSDK